MPEWNYEDLQGQSVEFTIAPDQTRRTGEFVISRDLNDGKEKVEILFFLPDPYQKFGGINRRLGLVPQQIERIRLHPAWEAASPLTPKFLLLA